MARVEKTVFISYRRTNVPWALAISQYLTHSGYDVFVDYTGVASGDFERVILDNIKARAHFLIMLTPSALERCGDPGDWLRREIETAIDTERNIVPLMLESFDFGAPSIASQLTGKLAVLRQYNGMSVNAEYFDAAMEKLRTKFLNVALDAVIHPASSVAKQAAIEQKQAVEAAATVLEEELTAQQWFERGYQSKNPEDAIRFYTNAIVLNPEFAVALYNRGILFHEKGETERAIKDYDEVLRLRPNDADALINRAAARQDAGNVDAAIRDYDLAIERVPNDAEAYFSRGIARSTAGDSAGALQDYDKALSLNPNYSEALVNRANVRGDLGDLPGALHDYDRAVQLNPDDADAYASRGLTRMITGDAAGALPDFDRAVQLAPSAESFSYRGDARLEIGDSQGALVDFDEALRLKPDHADALEGRDLVLKSIADRAKS